MLRNIRSSDSRFKPVELHAGLNIVLADKTTTSRDTDSRNGAGKSSIIEILHFALGMRSLTKSVLNNNALADHSFTVDMDWPNVQGRLSITRSLVRGQRSKVRLLPDVSRDTSLVDVPSNATIPEWTHLIGRELFGLPPEHPGISARSLLSFYMRRASQHGLDDAVKTHSAQSAAESATNLSYLFGLDWRLAANYQELAGRESMRKKLKEAVNDPSFRLVVGSASELRGQIAAALRRVRELETQVGAFRVVPEYERIQAEADELDRQIRTTRAADAADRRNLQDLEGAMQGEPEPDVAYLDRVYRELGVTLPAEVRRTYDEVRTFHESVVANRRGYLQEEIQATRGRLDARQADRDRMGVKHARLLRLLNDGGALTALMALQEQLSGARTELGMLESRFDTAKRFEATQAEIKFERSKLQQDVTRDLAERELMINDINEMFQRFAGELYGPSREAYVDIVPLDTSLRISPHIGGEDSQGISKMVVFCFDLTYAVIAHRSGRGPDFFVHDSHLFDGVDERQVGRALQLANSICREESIQYIATMNSDDLEKVASRTDLEQFVVPPRLTDAGEAGGLFGFRFE